MLKRIAIAFAAGVAILLVVIATRPSTFKIERSTSIPTPGWLVFSLVNDFRLWHTWSPWEKLDPAMKRTFGEKSAGEGASYAWAGNDQVGEGRMTITESKPAQRIAIKLEFLKPWAATNQATFTFTPQNGATNVAWIMDGEHDFMGKAFSLFMDMDQMVGKDFEKGLSQLSTVAQAELKRLEEEKKKKEAEAAAAAAATQGSAPEAGTVPSEPEAGANPAPVKPASVPAAQ